VLALCQSNFVSQSRCHCAYRSPAQILHPAMGPGHHVRWSVSLAVLGCSLSVFPSSSVIAWWMSSMVREPGVILVFHLTPISVSLCFDSLYPV
jgi:hypothetical protein